MDDNIKSLVMKMIDLNIRGADKYVHKESTWLIFTENKKWVIELTKERTLWDTLTLNDVDTVVVQKDNIRLRIVRNFDTIRVKAICLPDTVQVTKYINRTIKAPERKGDWEKYLMIFAVGMLLVVLIRQ